jgi:two-component system, LytTR family, sensor kinase
MANKFPRYRGIEIGAQVLIWVLLALFPLFSFQSDIKLIIRSSLITLLIAGLFYTNMYWLIPRFIFKKKVLFYAIIVIAILVALIFINSIINHFFSFRPDIQRQILDFKDRPVPRMRNPMHGPRIFIPILSMSIMALAVSSSFTFISAYIKKERQQGELENQKLNAELAMLRVQINPHFLFNVLNNICSLAMKKSDNTAPAIIKLSELMRYMIYDAHSEKVSLQSEIQYINNYIELQKMRLADSVRVTFAIDLQDTEVLVAPLILIPFVENAFKHGISYTSGSEINILLKSDKETLTLFVRNTCFKKKADLLDSGIGLENVERRLEILYPEKYTLYTDKIDSEYVVNLEIKL